MLSFGSEDQMSCIAFKELRFGGTKVNQHSNGLQLCPSIGLLAQRRVIHPSFIGLLALENS